MSSVENDEMSARVERLLTAQPTAPPEARRVRRDFEIVDRWEESQRHLGYCIEVDDEFAEAYRRPGQYVTLKVAGWPARFFVVASRPRRRRWEFLVDRKGELGPVLEEKAVGDRLAMSLPEGAGFDAAEAVRRQALLFCTGSGVATMRPLVEAWLSEDEERPQSISIFYGERRADDFAYDELFERWSKDYDVDVYRAVEADSERYPHRYVQNAFDAARPTLDDAYAYLSGAPVMIQVVAGKLLRLGVAPSRVKINI